MRLDAAEVLDEVGCGGTGWKGVSSDGNVLGWGGRGWDGMGRDGLIYEYVAIRICRHLTQEQLYSAHLDESAVVTTCRHPRAHPACCRPDLL